MVFGLSTIENQESCIYRVPDRMREVKPEAYTPRVVLIGPLHRSFQSEAAKDGAETSSNPWHLKKEYLKMEVTKKMYLESYTERFGKDTIEEMRNTIQAVEKQIRASYEESTEWIPSEYFVELILQDSVFIMEFLLRALLRDHDTHLDDNIVDHPFYTTMVINDLLLLENQIPYFIFHCLFRISMGEANAPETLDILVLKIFSLEMKERPKFKHFTDLFRCVFEESLDNIPNQITKNRMRWPALTGLWNADNLSYAGVKFKSSDRLHFIKSEEEEEGGEDYINGLPSLRAFQLKEQSVNNREWVEGCSLHVEFKAGCLTMSSFYANEASDTVLRNVIAFEQCHAALIPFTSNYIHFLNFLITSDRDVELLSGKGVVINGMGRPSLVVDMVNNLKVGVRVASISHYHDIAMDIKAHYKSRRKRCLATLRKVYFSDLWTGTATVAAVFLLFLTLVGTVASVIQAYKSF